MTTTPATPIDPKAKVLVRIAGHKSLPLEYAIAADKTKLALALTTFVDGMDGAEISDVETGPDGQLSVTVVPQVGRKGLTGIRASLDAAPPHVTAAAAMLHRLESVRAEDEALVILLAPEIDQAIEAAGAEVQAVEALVHAIEAAAAEPLAAVPVGL